MLGTTLDKEEVEEFMREADVVMDCLMRCVRPYSRLFRTEMENWTMMSSLR